MSTGDNSLGENALVELIDDPSPVVREALKREITRLGGAGIVLLKTLIDSKESAKAKAAEQMMFEVTGTDILGHFEQFIDSQHYDLETGMYLIARIFNPDLKPQMISREVDSICARCRELRSLPMNGLEQIKIINRVFFHEWGFRGNHEHYEDPQNSLIDQVLITRQGIPLSLCVVYLLVAEKLGLSLEPVAYPGHFLVGYFEGKDTIYIDPFERGRIRRVPELMKLLEIHGIEADFYHLTPSSAGEVLCRACRNLVRHLEGRGKMLMAGHFRSFVERFEATQEETDFN